MSIDSILSMFYKLPSTAARTTVRIGEGTQALTLIQRAAPTDDSDEALVAVLSQAGLQATTKKETASGATKSVRKEFGALQAAALADVVVNGTDTSEYDVPEEAPKRRKTKREAGADATVNGEPVVN